jgi:hypothetical protein
VILSAFLFLLTLQTAPPSRGEPPPVVVKLYEPEHDPTGLADVLLGALKLTGVWVLIAVGLGALMAYLLFWYRSRSD